MPDPAPIALPEDDHLFRLLRQLDTAPEASQRATAAALGISLGRLNSQLRAVTEAGLVAKSTRPGPDKRQRFSYALTPAGRPRRRVSPTGFSPVNSPNTTRSMPN